MKMAQPTIKDVMALISEVRRRVENHLGRTLADFERSFYSLPLRPALGQELTTRTYSSIVANALDKGLKRGFERYQVWTNAVDIINWHFRSRHKDGLVREYGDWLSGQVFFGRGETQGRLASALAGYSGRVGSTIPFLARSPYIELFQEESLEQGLPIIHYPLKGRPTTNSAAATTLTVSADILVNYLGKAELPDQFNRFPETPESGRLLPGELGAYLGGASEGKVFLRQLMSWFREFRLKGEWSSSGSNDEQLLRDFLPLTKSTLMVLRSEGYRRERSTCLAPVFVSGDDVGGFALVFDGLVTEEEAAIAEQLAHTSLSLVRLKEDLIVRHDLAQSVQLDYMKTFAVRRLSHGIRHPIATARATAERLSKEVAEIQKRVDESLQAILSRDVSNILRPQPQEDILWQYMEDIEYASRPQVQAKKGKSLRLELGEDLTASTKVRMDRQMIREAIENIISNAVEHGGSEIVFKAERLPPKTLVLRISDDGPGVGDPVYRALLAADSVDQFPPLRSGTRGIGLILSKLLVASQGDGSRLVYSDKLNKEGGSGGGMTTFSIVLPNTILDEAGRAA